MAVDKNLFLYDLAVVASAKDEEPYVKEWIDYYLLAGVKHFYIYNNGNSEEFKNILQPYIDRNIVTLFPGNGVQLPIIKYTEVIRKYRFFCRYMAFVDCDEFIFPKSKPTIPEVLDEILSVDEVRQAIGINWHCFGTNFQEKADYSRGVLERFTRRAPTEWGWATPEDGQLYGNWHIKTISNPRRVNIEHVHGAVMFEGNYSVNEHGKPLQSLFNNIPPTADKIIINHYSLKSIEEAKQRRGERFERAYPVYDKNEVLGLKSLGQIEKHSSGTWSFYITEGHFAEKTLKKIRQEAAK